MENLELIMSLAGVCIGLIVTVATLVAKYAKSAKARQAAEQTIKICNAIVPYIEQAEGFLHYSGEEKKEYVMTKANRYAIENNIAFDEDEISEKVEELIALSKEVNAATSETSGFEERAGQAEQKKATVIKFPSGQ